MRLENYIMEQDINTSTVADIFAEQAQAEFKVSIAIAESYAKEAAIMEYFTEGTLLDTATNKGVDESKLKKALLFIPRFFKAIFTRFIAMFKKKDVAAAKAMVDNIPDAVKSEVLVPMTEAELDQCMTAIENVAGLLMGRGSNSGIISKLDDFCELVYSGNYTRSNQLKFDENVIKSIETVENFNLSKIIAKHRAKYNELARRMANEGAKVSLTTKDEAESKKSNSKYKEDQLLASEGSWLGKMPTKKVNVDQATGGENFASVEKFEAMIKKLEELRENLAQFKTDADEAVKKLESAIKADEYKNENKQNPELRNAISDAIKLCGKVQSAAVHFCQEIENVIGIEMSIVNQVAHVTSFKSAKSTLTSFYNGTSYEGSTFIGSDGKATDPMRHRHALTQATAKKEEGGSWGLNDAMK